MMTTVIAKYYFKDGSTMEREYGTTPNGNPMGGRWVKRSADGAMIDFNQYRYDIIESDTDIVKVDLEE